MNVQEILNLRTQFEEITEEFKLEKYGSDINTLNWFVENGHKSNSLRDGFNDAYVIAQIILAEYYNDRQKNNRGFG